MAKATAPVRRTFLGTGLSSSALVQLILCRTICGTCGQELPSLIASQNDTGVSFRQNVCERNNIFARGNMDLRNALRDIELHPVFGDWGSEFFHLDPNTGGIDENDPGVAVRLVDKLAQRAGFKWRDSYGTYGTPMEGTSWTDLAVWATETYDFSVDFWFYSTDRLNMGIIFLPSWYDGSYIMVGEEKLDSTTNFLSWLAPFDYRVWIMIIVTVVLSGVIYWAMDRLNRASSSHSHNQGSHLQNNPTKKRTRFNNPTDNFYMSALAVTGHFEFHPDTASAMLLTFSLAFWSLLLLSAYTANLASFFVVKNTPTLGIKTIDDAVIQQLPICIWKGTGIDNYITKRFPAYPSFIRIEDEKENIMAAAGPNRRCQIAVTSISAWDVFEKQRLVNTDCKLSWIGRVINFVPASFVTRADSGTLCSSLVRDVLSLHFEEMKEAGELAQIWDDHIRKTASQNCAAGSASSTSATNTGVDQLNLQGLGGVFLTHFVLATVAVIVSVLTKLRKQKMARQHLNEDKNSEMPVLPAEQSAASTETAMLNVPKSSNGCLRENSKLIERESAEESRESCHDDSFGKETGGARTAHGKAT